MDSFVLNFCFANTTFIPPENWHILKKEFKLYWVLDKPLPFWYKSIQIKEARPGSPAPLNDHTETKHTAAASQGSAQPTAENRT